MFTQQNPQLITKQHFQKIPSIFIYYSEITTKQTGHPLNPSDSPTEIIVIMAEQSNIQLTYWDIRGLAQPLRHLFEYLKLPYTEVKITDPAKWYKKDIDQIGKKCLFPTLPYIVDDGFHLSEPISIAKYVCIKLGKEEMLGKTLEDEAKIDEILTKYVIFNNKLAELFRPQRDKDGITTERFENLFNELMSLQYFPYIIQVLKNKKWVFDYLTIVDFFTYESIFYMTGMFKDKLQFHCQLFQFMTRFQSINEIKAYNQSARLITKTFFGQMGEHWKGDPKFSEKQQS